MQRLSQSKPLADPLEEAAVNLLLAGAWLEERLDRVLAPLGITHAQYNVLRILRGARTRSRRSSSQVPASRRFTAASSRGSASGLL